MKFDVDIPLEKIIAKDLQKTKKETPVLTVDPSRDVYDNPSEFLQAHNVGSFLKDIPVEDDDVLRMVVNRPGNQVLSELAGPTLSTVLSTIAGAGLGRLYDKYTGGNRGVLLGGALGLSSGLLGGAYGDLVGKLRKPRTEEAQRTYDKSDIATVLNYLIPGMASYNYGRSHTSLSNTLLNSGRASLLPSRFKTAGAKKAFDWSRLDPSLLKPFFARIPEHINGKELAAYTGTGAALSGIIGYLKNRNKANSTRNVLLWMLGGGAAGAGAYAVKQNVLEGTNGLFSEKSKKDNPNPSPEGSDSAPPKQYIVYIPGMDTQHHDQPKRPEGSNIAVFPWGDAKGAIEYINKIRPKDQVVLIGHSAGGGTAIDVADKVKRKIDVLNTLDPVMMDIGAWLKGKLMGYRRPDNVSVWNNYIPTNRQARGDANMWVKYNPMLVGYIPSADKNIAQSRDHSMWETGLRLTPDSPTTWEPVELHSMRHGVH